MTLIPSTNGTHAAESVLQAYLLGSVELEAALTWQHRLVYEVGGNRDLAALILCEHPPGISVGRQGSRAHILCEPEELLARRWRVRWVNRGGGCWLHGPGQLCVSAILDLQRHGLGVHAYLERLHQVVIDVLDDFSIRGETRLTWPGVWVGRRMLAGVGVAVCDWISYFGIVVNINPDLEPFRRVLCGGPGASAMTSLERERRAPLSPALVRERFLEHFAQRFRFDRTTLFFEHPMLWRKASADATASRR